MPQLDTGGGGAGAGDDLGAPDELLAFQDEEVEQDGKSRDGPRDLVELKSNRPWDESTLRRDISRTNFQGP